jgi:hypothetical protein
MDQPQNSLNYSCAWRAFAERHYAKVFSKKYKNSWILTRDIITDQCRRIDSMLAYARADLIYDNGFEKIIKLDFSVAGTRISAKSSGNRCILYVDEVMRHVDVLVAYSKNDIGPPNETTKWKQAIKENYPDIAERFIL